jgi:hypothetical protein
VTTADLLEIYYNRDHDGAVDEAGDDPYPILSGGPDWILR